MFLSFEHPTFYIIEIRAKGPPKPQLNFLLPSLCFLRESPTCFELWEISWRFSMNLRRAYNGGTALWDRDEERPESQLQGFYFIFAHLSFDANDSSSLYPQTFRFQKLETSWGEPKVLIFEKSFGIKAWFFANIDWGRHFCLQWTVGRGVFLRLPATQQRYHSDICSYRNRQLSSTIDGSCGRLQQISNWAFINLPRPVTKSLVATDHGDGERSWMSPRERSGSLSTRLT